MPASRRVNAQELARLHVEGVNAEYPSRERGLDLHLQPLLGFGRIVRACFESHTLFEAESFRHDADRHPADARHLADLDAYLPSANPLRCQLG
jgi:hypothetical protein